MSDLDSNAISLPLPSGTLWESIVNNSNGLVSVVKTTDNSDM